MSDKLNKIWNDPKRTPVLIGLIAFNAGIGLGYFLGLRKKKITVLASTDQLEKIRVANQEKGDTIVEPKIVVEQTVDDIKEKIEALKAKREKKEATKATIVIDQIKEEPIELVTRSVFPKEDEWDFVTEIKNRNKDEPYVIHRDEFFSEENDYIQKQYTYYAGDSILCDDDNAPVYNHERVTGPLLFGHGSEDPTVVYIRNDKRKEEYEVLLDQGLYSIEVLGLEIEDNTRASDLKHTNHRRVRQGDDE